MGKRERAAATTYRIGRVRRGEHPAAYHVVNDAFTGGPQVYPHAYPTAAQAEAAIRRAWRSLGRAEPSIDPEIVDVDVAPLDHAAERERSPRSARG